MRGDLRFFDDIDPAVRVDGDVLDEAEIDDRLVELGVHHLGEPLPDLVDAATGTMRMAGPVQGAYSAATASAASLSFSFCDSTSTP